MSSKMKLSRGAVRGLSKKYQILEKRTKDSQTPNNSISGDFFQMNIPHLLELIFSFIERNRDCFSFSLSCKRCYVLFQRMLSMSSMRKYRLDAMNKNKNRVPYLFDLYDNTESKEMDFRIDPELFCTTREEYCESLKNDKIISILSSVNEKHGTVDNPVAMISGSYSLIHLLKKKRWTLFNEEKEEEKEGFGFRSDVDIYLLGEKKAQVLIDIVKLIHENFESPETFRIGSLYKGLYNIYNLGPGLDDFESKPPKNVSDFPFVKEIPNNLGEGTVYQFVLKSINKSLDDTFAFFDLDCCKIGIVPTKDRIGVMVCPAFIRSLFTGVNYRAIYRNRSSKLLHERTVKYDQRLGIRTMPIPEPLLSRFHTFRSIKFRVLNMVLKSGEIFDDFSRESMYEYYDMMQNSDDPDNYQYSLEEFSGRKSNEISEDASGLVWMSKNASCVYSIGIVKDKKSKKFRYKDRDFSEIAVYAKTKKKKKKKKKKK